jgi:hypothetical protein
MPISRPLSVVVAVLISIVGEVKAVTAQILPEPGKVSPAGVKAGPTADIAFYLARGDADSCGRGCNEWIAAEGKIDLGAAQRLRRLLAKLGRRRPPIFFHSTGGSITGSIELGRLIRDQKLEVSVAHTIPGGCDRDKPLDESCEALKRSGQELEAQFDPAIAMCNSGCVWAFLGGTTHFVPPWVKLGIHDVGLDPNKAPPPRISTSDLKRVAHARILEYVREMGIDKALPAATFAVPFESPRFLERDEIARYGIDPETSAKPVGISPTSRRSQCPRDSLSGLTAGASPAIVTALCDWTAESDKKSVWRLPSSTTPPSRSLPIR